jgi:hypothetical protein
MEIANAPRPVEPERVEVAGVAALLQVLGLPAPQPGSRKTTVEILPGRSVTFVEGEGDAPEVISICVVDIAAARREIAARFGNADAGPDTVHPETLRLCGRVLGTTSMIVAVHCPLAEASGQVPCTEACSPHLAFG